MSTELTSDEQRAIGEACRDLHIAHVEYRQVEAGWLARAAYERVLAEQPREHGPDHPTHKHPRVPGEPYCACFEHGFHVCAAEHWAVLCGEINYERRVAEQPREATSHYDQMVERAAVIEADRRRFADDVERRVREREERA